MKTLNEIDIRDVLAKRALIEAAKEWIKEIELGDWHCSYCEEQINKEGNNEWECNCDDSVVNWIKHFFNLGE